MSAFALSVISPKYLNAIEQSTNTFKFQHLSIEQGLSQSEAISIAQDKEGFIWIATRDGLNRFDGTHFVHYRHNTNDNHSIANNRIRKIFIDSNNTLWVGTENGLSRYNAELDNFDNFYNRPDEITSLLDNVIYDIYEDNGSEQTKQTLWVSTKNGIQKFNPNENLFSRLRIRGFEDAFKEIKTIFHDKQGNYWFGTFENGIYLLNSSHSYAVALKNNNLTSKWQLIINADALFDIEVIDNHYWLATDNGIYIVSENYELINHYTIENTSNALLSNNIRTIKQANDQQIWIGSEFGLNIFNPLTFEWQKITSGNMNKHISENWILDIYQDNTKSMWLATYGGGVNKYIPDTSLFTEILAAMPKSERRVFKLTETLNEKIWFANEAGKLFFFESQGNINEVKFKSQLEIDNIIAIKDDLWFTTYENDKLYQYQDNVKILNEFAIPIENQILLSLNKIVTIENSICYINKNFGLTCFDITSKEFSNFIPQDSQGFKALVSDNRASIWLTTKENTITQFSLLNKTFTNFLDNTTNKLSVDADKIAISKHWLWLGSDEQGIELININTKKSKLFNESSDLLNNFVADILIDENENAWVTSNKGVVVLNPQNKSIKNYSHDFGLGNDEFNEYSSLISSKKLIYVGSTNGIYKFDPAVVIDAEQSINPPQFVNIYIANKKIEISPSKYSNKDQMKLSKQIGYLTQLELKYDQFPLSIEFISPNPKLPNQTRYRYRLDGLEKQWIETNENVRPAGYTNLSPGNYTFILQAFDRYKPEHVLEKSLNIVITPPWWLSNAAIVIYSLALILFVLHLLQQIRHKRQIHIQIQQSEERLKLSLWGSGDEMWDWNIKTGKIFRSNIWGILEFPQDGKRNVGADETNIHPHDLQRVREALSQHFENKTDHFESTYRVKNQDDQWVWILDRGKIVDRNERGDAIRMTGTLKDISQIKKAEERLKLFAKCIENISDAVIIYDRQFTIVDVNKAFQRITGKNKQRMVGQGMMFENYPESFTQTVKKHLITKGSWHGEIESRRESGESFFSDLNIDVIRDENGNISHFVGAFSDITTRIETEAELRKLANSDTLTGLPNRSYFQANQTRLVKNKIPHALLVFDLDNFKKINDSMGHQVGDALLCTVAKRLMKIGSKSEAVYRLGGDEFSIIIENTNDIHTITTLAKKILFTIAQPMKFKNQEVVLFSSIGIVLYPEDGVSPQELLKNADTAMYHAKNLGGNKYQFFSDSMNKQAVKRLQIETLIRHGLKDDYFSVFFQPKIEIKTGKIAGMEALVRFETPTKGIISPVVFIPVSEETGQIIDIGEIVLRKSCFATKKWVDAGLFDGRIAVNLSAVQFTQPNLVNVINNILKESQLPAKYLELEITEGTVMDNPQKAIDTMHQIRAMGIHLSLDDFGTGYSSLAYLKKFPLNTLKIDKAFVDDIEVSEQGRNMVATIVTIAHNLGMQVVAEGVETNRQLNFLAGLNCEQLQGYLYSKPIPENEFQKYLISHQITDQSTSSITKGQ